jgi:hypothetical protein
LARANKTIISIAVPVLKLIVGSSLFYFLISKVGGRLIIDNISGLNPLAFTAAIGLYLLGAVFSTLRWKLLIPSSIRTGRLFSMYMIGSFFNTYMPGMIGGDAVKAFYLSRELKGFCSDGNGKNIFRTTPPLPVAIGSIFMDRYIGLSALLVIAMLAIPFGISYLKNASKDLPILWVIPTAVMIFAGTSVIIFKFRLGQRLDFLSNTYHYFQEYAYQKRILLGALLYSVLVQFLGILAVYVLGKGLLLPVSFLSLLIFLPIIVLFSMIPLSISGIGLREGAFVFLLGTIGIPPAAAISLSLVWFLSVFVAGIWGLVEYLRFKSMLGREEK